MAISTEFIKKYALEILEPKEEKDFYESLLSIANLVIRRHFNNLQEDEKLDAQSEAITSALVSLRQPHIDFETYDALNYTYTGMRNTIHNYFRKFKDREISMAPELFDVLYHNNNNRGFIFDEALSHLHSLYDIEYIKVTQRLPDFKEFFVSFDEAILRLDVVDSVLLFRAFQQLKKESYVNYPTIRDKFEQHRD